MGCRVRVLNSLTKDRSVLCAASLLAASLLLAGGCATAPDPSDPEAVAEFREVNDPAEPLNRAVFKFNQAVDAVILEPASGMYHDIVPPAVRTGVYNALNNLRSPVILFNDVLQGEFERARNTLTRFAINSTVGVLGLWDPATKWGYPIHDEDFGQTMAVWGAGGGPYVMLPVLGPSNPRDTVGLVVDVLVDPFAHWASNTDRAYANYARGGTRAVDERSRNAEAIDALKRSSIDFYAAVRSLYRQRRANSIANENGAHMLPAPGLTGEPTIPDAEASDEVSQESR